MRQRRFASLVLALLASLMTLGADAAEPRAAKGSDEVDQLMARYNLHPAFEKLGRGVANTLGGWLEVPLNVQKRYTVEDTGSSFFTGLAIGATKGLVRTVVGLYETVTFFLPYPEDYVPILPTLEYFKRADTRRQPLLLE